MKPYQTICHVMHGLRMGGAEVLAARLARRYHGKRVEATDGELRFAFICLDELGSLGEELRRDGLEVRVVSRRPGVDWRCSWRLARALREMQVDLVHAHQYTPFFYSVTARLLFRRPPVLLTEHGRWLPDYPRPKRKLANRLLLERRDRVVGVGNAVRRALVDNDGFPAERAGVIHNGIDLARFDSTTETRWAVRADIGCRADDLVVVQVARLDSLKDHATAARAVERAARQRPELRWVVVGEGPEASAIEALAAERGIERHVIMLGLRTDVPRILQAADIALLTSKSEGIPLTLIEAMAAGRPVVSTDVGGVPEVVVDGETGLLAPCGDDARLAEHLVSLAVDPARRAELGRQGSRRARQLFSEDRMHASYINLYAEMLHE
jgi:glycosyltransferase involved in cell wall biosynthesis